MKKPDQQAVDLNRHFETMMIYVAQAHAAGDAGDLNKQESNAIYTLGQSGAAIMRELAENLRLHVSTVTGLIDKLIEKGYVHRERSDEDRRIVRVSLTDLGRRAYEQELVKRADLSRAILDALDPEERQTLVRLFGKVADHLARITTDHSQTK